MKNGLESVLAEHGYAREYGDGCKYHLDTASFALSEDLEALAEDIDGYKAVLDSVMAGEALASSRVENLDRLLDEMQGDYYELPDGVQKKGLATLKAEGDEAIAESNAAIADKDAAFRQADTVIAETEQLLAARKKLEEDDKEVAQDPLTEFAAYLETSEAGGPGHRSTAKSCLANYRRKLVADRAANGAESADVIRATEKAVQQAKRTLGEAGRPAKLQSLSRELQAPLAREIGSSGESDCTCAWEEALMVP